MNKSKVKFILRPEEVAKIKAPVGSGGYQNFYKKLQDQLKTRKRTIYLDDNELGRLIRFITQYGSGGYQSRLRGAFKRSLGKLINV